MIKRILPMLLTVLVLSATAYAAEPDLPEGVSVTDITEQQPDADYTPPEHFPADIQTKTEDGVRLLLKTFEVGPEVSPADLVEPNLAQNGVEYELCDVLRTVVPDEQEKKTVSQMITVSSESDDADEILKLLKETLDYNADGFTGQLAIDESSITTDVEDTEGYTYAVTETREYTGLARNDPALIPKTVEKNGLTYSLADIQWSGGSENAPAASYTATVFYKASASGSRPSEYLVTATYTGEVVKTVPGNIVYTLVYAAKPVMLPVDASEPLNWTPMLFVLGGVIVAGGIGAAVVFFLRRRKAAVVYEDEAEEEPKKRMRIPNMLSEMEDDVDE